MGDHRGRCGAVQSPLRLNTRLRLPQPPRSRSEGGREGDLRLCAPGPQYWNALPCCCRLRRRCCSCMSWNRCSPSTWTPKISSGRTGTPGPCSAFLSPSTNNSDRIIKSCKLWFCLWLCVCVVLSGMWKLMSDEEVQVYLCAEYIVTFRWEINRYSMIITFLFYFNWAFALAWGDFFLKQWKNKLNVSSFKSFLTWFYFEVTLLLLMYNYSLLYLIYFLTVKPKLS